MLYYLPYLHPVMVRYYAISTHMLEENLGLIEGKKWKYEIENSFKQDHEICPDCGSTMNLMAVFSR